MYGPASAYAASELAGNTGLGVFCSLLVCRGGYPVGCRPALVLGQVARPEAADLSCWMARRS